MAGKRHPNYPPEFRNKAVELVLSSGHSIPEVAHRLEINEGTLSTWVTNERKKIKGADVEQMNPHNAIPQGHQETAEKYTQQTSMKDRRMAAEQNSCNWEFVTDEQCDPPSTPIGNKANVVSKPQIRKQDSNLEEPEILQNQESPADFVVSEMFETLRQENRKLKQQRNTLRDAIILLATHTSATDS